MTTDIATTDRAELDTYRTALATAATQLGEKAMPANTRRVYEGAVRDFNAFCQTIGADAVPAEPQTVALYVAHLAVERSLASSTVAQRLAAIQWIHKRHGHRSPTTHPAVVAVAKGARIENGTAPNRRCAIGSSEVVRIVAVLDDSLIGKRDRALLLVGFAGAFRRSELAALTVEDFEAIEGGLRVTVRRSKTDQEGAGRVFELAKGTREKTCPVRALRVWLDASGIEEGPVFRSVSRWGKVADKALSSKAVALVVKRAADAAGLDPSLYAGHSLRRGFVTSARRAGKSDVAIRRVTGHKTARMLDVYTELDSDAADSANAGLL